MPVCLSLFLTHLLTPLSRDSRKKTLMGKSYYKRSHILVIKSFAIIFMFKIVAWLFLAICVDCLLRYGILEMSNLRSTVHVDDDDD